MNLPPPKQAGPAFLSRRSRDRRGNSRAISRIRNERTGCPPYARREYEAVPLETIAGEEGDERKVRKEGSSLACANRGASFRAARCAPRLHLPEIHHIRVPPPPPPSPSPPPAPFTSTCLFAFASTFSLCVLLCSLASHGTQLPTTSLS